MPDQLVSVIMPAYNAGAFISRSMESVCHQTYTNWELLVIDDGSTDDTKHKVLKLAETDTRVIYIYQENKGQGAARNKGIAHAKGGLVAFLDADDIWMPQKLEKQLVLINSTNADIVFSDVIVIDETDRTVAGTWGVADTVYAGEKGKLAFIFENRVPILTVLAKKKSILQVNGFSEDENMRYVEDYDLWLRMLENGAAFFSSSEKLACYRHNTHKSPARKKTLINVADVIKNVSIHDDSLQAQKNKAKALCARRIIKRCSPGIYKSEMNKIISLLSSPFSRNIYFILNNVFGALVTGKIILLFTRRLLQRNRKGEMLL